MISTPQVAARFKGPVISPDDPTYDEARQVFAGGVDRWPSVIVRVADADDVARGIALARETGLELAVRSGGHSPAGHGVSDGGIVLDLADMRGLEIDVEGRTAWAETGLTAGEYTAATGAHGLATGFGDAGSVGIGGITLSGGVGFLVRKHGLTIDNLLAAEVVTADGELVRADADTRPDLFWAIRGGGGNFGVATRFQFRLHEVDTIVGGPLFLPATPDVISGFIAEAQAAPEELSTIVERHARSAAAVPPGGAPRRAGGDGRCWRTPGRSTTASAPSRRSGTSRPRSPTWSGRCRIPSSIPRRTRATTRWPRSARRSWTASTASAADTIVERLQASTAEMGITQLRVLGGAMARVPADATAFAHRSSPIMASVVAIYDRPEERAVHEDWVAGLAAELMQRRRRRIRRASSATRVRSACAPPTRERTWDRLAAIKAPLRPGQPLPAQPERPSGAYPAARSLTPSRRARPSPPQRITTSWLYSNTGRAIGDSRFIQRLVVATCQS